MSLLATRCAAIAVRVLFYSMVCAEAFAAGDITLGNIASTANPTARENSSNLILGYSIYLEQINAQGGVRGRKVKLLNKDDGVIAENMTALTRELIADREVIALAGFLNTAGIAELARSNVMAEKGIAMIAPVSSLNGPNFYPLRPGYNDEALALLREAQSTLKKRIAMVYYNQAFGPPVFKFSQEAAKNLGLEVVATAMFETAPEKMEAGIVAAAEGLSKANPDAVLVIAAGTGAFNFVKRLRATAARDAQVYTLSAADSFAFVKVAGVDNAQGVVISQAIPYPNHTALAVVREYQKAMKQYGAGKPLSFFGLEGFMGAKIAVEALNRAGPNPTRAKVIAALDSMSDFDLGDFRVSYSPAQRTGSKTVDLTIIGKNGMLYR